jgi:hypothetical protein
VKVRRHVDQVHAGWWVASLFGRLALQAIRLQRLLEAMHCASNDAKK